MVRLRAIVWNGYHSDGVEASRPSIISGGQPAKRPDPRQHGVKQGLFDNVAADIRAPPALNRQPRYISRRNFSFPVFLEDELKTSVAR